MSPAELERYCTNTFRCHGAVQVSVRQSQNDGVVLAAPIAPNIYHREPEPHRWEDSRACCIAAAAQLEYAGREAGRSIGEFVALGGEAHAP